VTNRITPVSLSQSIRAHVAQAARCGNCEQPFQFGRKAKGVVGIPNGGGYSIYVLCSPCARLFKRDGAAGIPTAVRDAQLATLLQFAPSKGTA
jgi:hypothetical protein